MCDLALGVYTGARRPHDVDGLVYDVGGRMFNVGDMQAGCEAGGWVTGRMEHFLPLPDYISPPQVFELNTREFPECTQFIFWT